MPLTDAQKRAKENYNKKNPEKVKRIRYFMNAKTFVRHYATKKDMEVLTCIFQEENLNAKEG